MARPESARSCAQRLSASLLSSHSIAPVRRNRDRVLNAFRHHCCRHGRVQPICPTRSQVLNAFRHHCCRHRRSTLRSVDFEVLCSTPFGITAVVTSGDLQHEPADTRLVLNAFRHHCCRAPRPIAPLAMSQSVCSTPFGITAVGTPSLNYIADLEDRCAQRLSASLLSARDDGPGDSVRPSCAQRLSASLLSAQRGGGRQRSGAGRLCSTPFGITAVVTDRVRTTASSTAPSAQRLSASLRSSLAHAAAPPRLAGCAQRLSASLRSSHRVRGRLAYRSTSCSTPFGITAVVTKPGSPRLGHP